MSIQAINKITNGKLTIQAHTGRLIDHFSLTDVNYKDSYINIKIAAIDFSWKPKELFAKKIMINKLIIDNFTINSNSNKNSTSSDYFSYYKVLKYIFANEIQIRHLHIQSGVQQDLSIETINLANEDNKYHLIISGANGKINYLPIKSEIDLSYDKQVHIHRFYINYAKSNLTISGEIDHQFNLAYTLDMPSFDGITNSIKGSLFSKGKMIGPVNSPQLTAKINLNEISSEKLQIPSIKGDITANALLKNNIEIVDYKISALFNSTQFKLPGSGIIIKKINIAANTDIKNIIKWQGRAQIEKDTITLNGETNLHSEKFLKTKAELSGSRIKIANSRDLKIVVTPNLYFNYNNNVLTTTGSVFIPAAKIVRYQSSNVIALSNDVSYVNQKTSDESNLIFVTDVTIGLGDRIELDYQNLNTQLLGSLHLQQEKNGLLTATGSLNTKNGTYTAYGKKLKIKTGRVIYLGNAIDDPGLDIEAIRTIDRFGIQADSTNTHDKIIVGIRITGMLSKPELSLFSTPTMNKNDILSYLIFDTPTSRLSIGNSLTLMNIATSMNTNKKSGFMDNIQKKIDKIGITTGSAEIFDPIENTSTTASTIGINKKFGKKITVSYQASPFNNFSAISLKYQLSKYLSLKTEASNLETTTDLILEVEKD